MSDLVFAYTAPFSPLPEFINVYETPNGSYIVTVRSMGTYDVSKVAMSPEHLKDLADSIYKHLGSK